MLGKLRARGGVAACPMREGGAMGVGGASREKSFVNAASVRLWLGSSLLWAWAMFFHENAYRMLESTQSDLFVNQAVPFCTFWTIGALAGCLLAMAFGTFGTDRRKLVSPLLAAGLLAGLAYYGISLSPAESLGEGSPYLSMFFLGLASLCAFAVLVLVLAATRMEVRAFVVWVPLTFVLSTLLSRGFLFLMSLLLPFYLMAVVHMALLPAAWFCLATVSQVDDAGSEAPVAVSSLAEGSRFSFLRSPRRPLWLHLLCYGLVFGLLHRIHGGMEISPETRILAYSIGAVAGSVVFFAMFFRKPVSMRGIWKNVTRFVFPMLMASCLLIPQVQGFGAMLISVLSETAQNCYVLIVLLACLLVTHETNVPASWAYGKASAVWFAGILIGQSVAIPVRMLFIYDIGFYSALATAVFLVLVLSTFELNIEPGMKTYWGLVSHLDPKALFDMRVKAFCEQSAQEFALTPRETEVLRYLVRNKRADEIREDMVVSITTVRKHTQNIYAKMNVHSQKELVLLAKRYAKPGDPIAPLQEEASHGTQAA